MYKSFSDVLEDLSTDSDGGVVAFAEAVKNNIRNYETVNLYRAVAMAMVLVPVAVSNIDSRNRAASTLLSKIDRMAKSRGK